MTYLSRDHKVYCIFIFLDHIGEKHQLCSSKLGVFYLGSVRAITFSSGHYDRIFYKIVDIYRGACVEGISEFDLALDGATVRNETVIGKFSSKFLGLLIEYIRYFMSRRLREGIVAIALRFQGPRWFQGLFLCIGGIVIGG